jgi:WD40 repeat protein
MDAHISPTLPIQPTKPEPKETPASVLKQQPVQPEPLVTSEDFSWLCIRTLRGHQSIVRSVAFSLDGQTLASGSSDDQTIKLWNVKTGDLLRTLTGHEDYVNSVAMSADCFR